MHNLGAKTMIRQSLRYRYILVAVSIAVLLVIGAIGANMYVKHVSDRNTAALQLRDSVTEIIGDIRNSIRRADAALNAMLISPPSGYEEIIKDSLQFAIEKLHTLSGNEAIESADLSENIADLQIDLRILKDNVYKLMELRQDSNWVYPMLPFISTTLLESNTTFENSAATALNAIADAEGKTYAAESYRLVDEARDLWRLMILNFRAIVIRFAGLNRMDNISQERNVSLIYEQIQNKLSALRELQQQGALEFETEIALENMQRSSTKWYKDFQDFKKLKDSKVWRADIHFIETNIRPHQEHTFSDLTELAQQISIWSSHNVSAVEQAATQVSLELWALSGVALGFVILVYFMIDRSILTPIARISATISEENESIVQLDLPQKSSREIHSLINAFNTMQRQIRHRQVALEYQALHDSLTGLPNRALLQDRLEHGIHLAHRRDSKLAILLLDLNRFKEINDTLGHPVGDRILQIIANRLEKSLRESDTVARLGGDEFAILLPDTDLEQASAFVKKVVEVIDEVITIDNKNLYVSASVGIALYPTHGTNAATLIRQADIAMYSAKQGNRGFAVFEKSMDEHNVDNLSLLGDLRNEIEHNSGQIKLYYQPKIDLSSEKAPGVEALLRWKHPNRGYIPPDQVVRMSEQTGLIANLSNWVLEQAISDCAAWMQDGIDVNTAINISAWNLQDPELPAMVKNLLAKYDLNPDKLTLEITESAVMEDPVRAAEVLQQLDDMGISLAIDDYGTGFSSLAYLKLLPVHALKIDKSFVIDMLDDENDSIIVRSTIDLAHNLGLMVIAEGVENMAVLQSLRQLKCDFAQGFYFSRPVPATQFVSWYKSYSPQTLERGLG